jgi:hypothetical protein
MIILISFFFVKVPAADATDAPQPWGLLCNPVMKMFNFFFVFPCNGAPVDWNWQGKTEILGGGGEPIPVPLCPPQIPHGLTRDRTWASAVRSRPLTAWAMARPLSVLLQSYLRRCAKHVHELYIIYLFTTLCKTCTWTVYNLVIYDAVQNMYMNCI